MAAWEEREKEELLLDNGCLYKAHKDTAGNWVIGVGHRLESDPHKEWTQEQISVEFLADFENAETATAEVVPFFSALDGPRKGALVNLAFSIGGAGLSALHGMLAAMDSGDWDTAALYLMGSRYARRAGDRVKRLAYRIRTGEYSLR